MRVWPLLFLAGGALLLMRSDSDVARDVQLSPNFWLREFASRGQLPKDPKVVTNLRQLAEQLEILRAELGGSGITIVSGWRSLAHNNAVSGARKSQHLVGRAADIRVAGVAPAVVKATIERLISAGKMLQGGLAQYGSSFVHYDTRGWRARW